jgi:drug/metabolite transporter (DMT)-like permease
MQAPPQRAQRATPALHLALIAVQVFFASFSAVGKIALREVPPLELAAVRVTLAAAIFAIVWLAAFRERVARGDVLRLAVYAFFGIVANQLLFLTGLAHTTATAAVVLGTSIPAFTVGVAVLLGRERATAGKLAGLAVALAGALVLTGGPALLAAGGREALVGNVYILVNSLSYAIYLVISRDVLARVRPLTAMVFVFLFGALAIDAAFLAGGALGLVGGGGPALLARLSRLTPAAWEALAYIVLVPTVAAYLLNAVALRVVPASLVAIYIYVQPFVGAMIAAWLLGERPTISIVVGAGFIFAGIGLVNRDAVRRRAA